MKFEFDSFTQNKHDLGNNMALDLMKNLKIKERTWQVDYYFCQVSHHIYTYIHTISCLDNRTFN